MTFTRRAAAAAALSLVLSAGSSQAAAIVGLFNTGTDANNVALVGGNGVIDPHYLIAASTSPGFAGQQALTYAVPDYVANDADSRWISLSTTGQPGFNTTVYRTSFDLTGLDPATAQISGLWGSDNNSLILFNGVSTGFSLPAAGVSFFFLHAFTISNGFVAGVNHLDFQVTDVGPPTALRVDNLSGTAGVLVGGVVPEPATWALMLGGFGLVGGMIRRRNSRLRLA